jgi:hypothetical protein
MKYRYRKNVVNTGVYMKIVKVKKSTRGQIKLAMTQVSMMRAAYPW